MVATCKLYKKVAPNGRLTLYLPKREFIDHVTHVDCTDGVVLIDDEYLKNRQVYGHMVAIFRYGREEDEVMGLKFSKELYLASQQIYPPPAEKDGTKTQVTRIQERLINKLGPNAYPFSLQLPNTAPHSVVLHTGSDFDGQPCGVYYEVRILVGSSQHDRGHKRNTVSMGVRKVQRAKLIGNRQPCSIIRKDFLLSPGHLELEVTLDRQVYEHGDTIPVNVSIRNHSNKTVKRIRLYAIQNVDVCMFASGHCHSIVASMDTDSGCPVEPGSTLHKVAELTPSTDCNIGSRGLALDSPIGDEPVALASSTILPENQQSDPFGIIVSYTVKVKLVLGALGGEVVAEIPFVMMNPGSSEKKVIADLGTESCIEEKLKDLELECGNHQKVA